MRSLLGNAVGSGQLRSVDLHAAVFLEQLSGRPSGLLLLAAALTSRAVGEGHICLPLAELAGRTVFPDSEVIAPGLREWRQELLASGVVGLPGGPEPLILDAQNRLYLARYHTQEDLIARDLLQRSRPLQPIDEERAAELLARLFPTADHEYGQRLAAAMAALTQFVVIAGGPGTGKTYTVARILGLLQALAGGELRIALAAPTGKAAARMQESIRKAKEEMPSELASLVPEHACTLHRLLGMIQDTGRFRHNSHNPLHVDLLVIDEASMVDVPLMASVVEALPPAAKLIMLGDRNQLTSVEAGSLFSDICGLGEAKWSAALSARIGRLTGVSLEPAHGHEGMADCITHLHRGFRFGKEGGIGALARIVNAGDEEGLAGLAEQRYGDLIIAHPATGSFRSWLADRVLEGFHRCVVAETAAEALAEYARFRVLCAVREGAAGVVGVNQLAEQVLRKRGMIVGSSEWYRGRPLLIRRNHYGLQLYNGDTGIVWPDEAGKVWAWFARPDGTLLPVAPSLLPACDTAYAVTVHQAQGSEFDEVLFLLPVQDNRILSRELIYTGLTRARRKLTVADSASLLSASIQRSVVRYSGLADKLWGGAGEEVSALEK